MSEARPKLRESGFFENIIAENQVSFLGRPWMVRLVDDLVRDKNGMPGVGYTIPAGVVRSMTVVPVTLPGEQEPRDANRAEDGF